MSKPQTSVKRAVVLTTLILLVVMVLAGSALAQETSWYASYWNNTTQSGPPALQRIESGGSGGAFGGGDTAMTIPTYPNAVVNTTHLNIRGGPGTEYDVLRVLDKGDVVMLTGLTQGSWVHVQTADNFAGWVNGSYLAYNMPASQESLSNK